MKARLFSLLKNRFFLAMLCAAAILLIAHRRELSDNLLVYADVDYYYLLNGWRDASLLGKDPFMTVFRADKAFLLHTIPFVRPLLPLEVWLSGLVSISQLLAWKGMLMGMAAAFLVFLTGRRLAGENGAFHLTLLFSVYSFLCMDTYFGGLMRSLGGPLTCLILYLLVCEKPRAVALLLPVVYFFYAGILPFTGCAALLAALFVGDRSRRAGNMITLAAVCAVLGAYMLVFDRWLFSPSAAYHWKDIMERQGGIVLLRNYFLNVGDHPYPYLPLTLVFLFGGAVAAAVRRNIASVPRGLAIFGAAFMAAFCVLALASPGGASRQTVLALPLFSVVFFWLLLLGARRAEAVFLSLSALVLIVGGSMTAAEAGVYDFRSKKPLYGFIKSQPLDSLVFAHPEYSKFIPLFTARPVYFHPIWLDILPAARGSFVDAKYLDWRIEKNLRAYYSSSLEPAAKLVRDEGVTLFVVESSCYDYYLNGPKHWFYIFLDRSRNIAGEAGGNFALYALAQKKGLRVLPETYVLDGETVLREAAKK